MGSLWDANGYRWEKTTAAGHWTSRVYGECTWAAILGGSGPVTDIPRVKVGDVITAEHVMRLPRQSVVWPEHAVTFTHAWTVKKAEVASYGGIISTAVRFLYGRLHFHHPDGTRARANAGAPSVLVAYGPEDAARLATCTIPGKFIHLRKDQSLTADSTIR